MEQTQVMVHITIYGNEFPLETVTQKLGIKPTQTYTKGDVIPSLSVLRYRKETAWQLGTGSQASCDVDEQIQQVIGQLKGKETALTELMEMYSLECLLMIVIVIEDGRTPALYLNKDVVDFVSSIRAEIHFDLYANPYGDEMD